MDKKQKSIIIRAAVSVALTIVAVLVKSEGYIRLITFLIPYLLIGYDVIQRSARNISRGNVFDENFLMTIATIGAFVIQEYPEAVSVMLFYQIGELFQDLAIDRSRKSISDLMDIRPDHANLEKDGSITKVDPGSVSVGDTIVIFPGDRVPLDGTITEGSSSLNMASLTGESLPKDITEGDRILSGCVNINGMIKVKTDTLYGESTVTKILDLIENSSGKKAKTENFITKFSRYYTPVVVALAALLAVVPPLLFHGVWSDWVYRALIFLVVSCPCALVISIPLCFFCAIGGASKNGILIKGSNYIEAVAKADTVVFDKTGTLTKGIFKVTAVHPDLVSREELLEIAVLAESYSNHPISISLKNEYHNEVDRSRITKVEEIPGHGVRAVIDGKAVSVGNGKLMDMDSVSWHECHISGTTVHVAVNNVYMGHIVISDEIKDDAKDAISKLKEQGISRLVMLTGDSKNTAEHIATELGITEVHSNLLPAGKVGYVENSIKNRPSSGKLIFVGDGINDAPVLSMADVGISMGGLGSDAAIEASDIVIMDDKPSKIAKLIGISKKTISIAKQNIAFAIGIKILVMVLSAFGIANMWEAVFADVGVSVISILNSIRILKKQ